MSNNNIEFISDLEAIIESRRDADAGSSYTKQLFDRGTPYIAQKVGEEAVELAIAAVLGDQKHTIEEASDLLYHLLVLLSANNIKLADIANELADRHS
jgi:phosphoribosyl-ATP pyrophosphohydrolase